MTGAEAILRLGKKLYGNKFEITPNLAKPYEKIFNHFIEGLDKSNKQKSLLLVGGKGLSKTSIMRIMGILFSDSNKMFKTTTSSKIISSLKDFSYTEIMEMYGGGFVNDLYIDDIGVRKDNEIVWGNKSNIISEIIQERYPLFVSKGILTHLSSNIPIEINSEKVNNNPNLSIDEKNRILESDTLLSIYGERVADRLKEMCEVVLFTGESLRRK